VTDLALEVRSLAQYGLPMTGLRNCKDETILFGSGGLLLGELGSSLLLGLRKSTAAIAGENPANLSAYAGAAITQKAGIAGYRALRAVGRAAEIYLGKAAGAARASTVRDSQSRWRWARSIGYDRSWGNSWKWITANRCLVDGRPYNQFACICKLLVMPVTIIIALEEVSS